MCGIIGYIGDSNRTSRILIDSLKTLEYRGYDSAGVCLYNDKVIIKKEKGKICNLEDLIDFDKSFKFGIGHTRWATHGIASKTNSHPHNVGKFTIVHNGIIENYIDIKNMLIEVGYNFKTETDSEIACALFDYYYKDNSIEDTFKLVKEKLVGAYAFGIICDDFKESFFAMRKDSPLIIGVSNSEFFIASDVPAILNYTKNYILLDNLEHAVLTKDKVQIYDSKNNIVEKETKIFEFENEKIEKLGYDHFMLKEIFEQPKIIDNNLKRDIKFNFRDYDSIDIVACGSAYHAGLVGEYFINNYSKIKCNSFIASEYRYQHNIYNDKKLIIVISQSGETADSLAVVNLAKENSIDTLGIINAKGSSIARIVDYVIYTEAGIEIAVATTKGYTSQVSCFSKLVDNDLDLNVLNDLNKLLTNYDYKSLANNLKGQNNVFFIGRGIDYKVAMEASLKLKEISYIHSEAYPAGELKHGTISLISKNTLVVAIITDPKLAEKTISNIKEVKARGAYVLLIARADLITSDGFYDELITLPAVHPLIMPIYTILPLQMLSYYIALLRDCDIDKPRNLAKSVTVE